MKILSSEMDYVLNQRTGLEAFRRLQPDALDRFCQKVLAEIDGIAADANKTYHERYLAIYERIQYRDKELANAFDGPRRSTAIQQLAHIQAHALLTPEEMSNVSTEIRNAVPVSRRIRVELTLHNPIEDRIALKRTAVLRPLSLQCIMVRKGGWFYVRDVL